MRRKNWLSSVAIGLFSLVMFSLCISPLRAQSFYGSVVGTVTDSSGAVVPGATVTVTNVGTNESQTASTDSGGKYSFVNLVPATYTVAVEKAGFKRFVGDNVQVQVGAVLRRDAQLAVGAATETVEVSTTSPLLQTDTSSLSQEVEGEQVQEMPLNGRNVLNLIALAPGVVPTGGSMGSTELNGGHHTITAAFNDYEIGGALQGQSGSFIDGVPNNVLGGNGIALVATQDAVQELNVATSNAGPDFGRYSGGVINMATRSGSNVFHGSIYEYFRNTAFNANDYFSNENGTARGKWNQSQFGAILTGPIKKDKAFFMLSWEGFSARTSWINETNLPTVGMQNGIIPEVYSGSTLLNSNVVDPRGNCIITHQPGTPSAPGTWTITNLYQGNCGDPTNRVIKTYYPAPNANLPGTNFYLTDALNNDTNQYTGRFDYNVSPNQRVFARYTFWKVKDGAHSEFENQGFNGAIWPTNDGVTINRTHQAVIGDTYTINPTTIADVRLDYVRLYAPNPPQSTTVNESLFGSALAALSPQMSFHGLPSPNISGVHNLYNNWGGISYGDTTWKNTYGINFSLTKILGAHSLKFGGEFRLMDSSNSGGTNQEAGMYCYGQTFSGSTNSNGDEWASFLMGYPSGGCASGNSVGFQTVSATASYNYYQGYYVSDNWQATHRLTLNLGLRWELPGGIAERHDRATVLLPTAVDPYTGITGTLALVNSALYPHRPTVLPEFNLFAPRLGFAYRATENTVVRAGYGISYLPNDLQNNVLPSASPVNAAETGFSASSVPTPLQTILQTFVTNGLNRPAGRTAPNFMTLYGSRTTYLGQSITGPIPNQPFPFTQQWNLDLSHQFQGNWMAEVTYSGTKGLNIPGIGLNLNELPDKYDSLGSALQSAQAGGCPNANGEAMSVGQCLRPYPYYNGVTDAAQYYGRTSFKSFQSRVTKRFGTRGLLMANYTWSKNQGNTDTMSAGNEATSSIQGQGGGRGNIQDYNNLSGEYSLVSYDVTNRAIVSYVLPLPFGKGQQYGNSFGGVTSGLISGWAINGITTFQSGFPLYFTTANNTLSNNFGAGTIRPNVVPGCSKSISGSGLSRVQAGAWFNINCFVNPGNFSFGNEPRVDPDLRADGQKNFDFAFQKSTSFHESANVEFRTEFFNLFNRVQFAPPVTQQNAGNFGAVTYQVNKPRQIQLSLRVNF